MGVRRRGGWARLAAALTALLALALASGCGASNGNGEITLTVGARDTPEEEVLGSIYALALEDAGYTVRKDFNIDSPESGLNSLEEGHIDGYPVHLNALLEPSLGFEAPPADTEKAYAMAKALSKKDGLVAFRPTPYSLSRPVVVLRKTAEKHNLETFSDLKGPAEKMTLLGPDGCHIAHDCLGGIERVYGTTFLSSTYMVSARDIRRRYSALENGLFDAVILDSTEGRLAAEKGKFIALDEDKHAFPAGNAVFVTSRKLVEKAGPDLEATIEAAQEGLTLAVIRQLDAEVELEGKDPARVAARYLKQVMPTPGN